MGEFNFFYNDNPIAPIVEIGELPNEKLSHWELSFWEKFHNPYLIDFTIHILLGRIAQNIFLHIIFAI